MLSVPSDICPGTLPCLCLSGIYMSMEAQTHAWQYSHGCTKSAKISSRLQHKDFEDIRSSHRCLQHSARRLFDENLSLQVLEYHTDITQSLGHVWDFQFHLRYPIIKQFPGEDVGFDRSFFWLKVGMILIISKPALRSQMMDLFKLNL